MRSLAVIPVATAVLCTELLQLQLHQERDELFPQCECGKNVDYTDRVIRDVLLDGISHPGIRLEVLGTKNVLQTPVNEVIAQVPRLAP